ncbi:Rne/Rng family ribonuclease [Leptospira interrogans]
MSNNKMLIDATHPEETRVVVLKGGRVEEFDFESAARKLLRGNIFLAKVTRVEPSLQAAFVDYGGNRHGFLAFNEIHPDYYQIPVADRQALIDEEAAADAEEEAEADAAADRRAERQATVEPAHEDDDPPEEVTLDVTAFLPPEPEAPSATETEPEATPYKVVEAAMPADETISEAVVEVIPAPAAETDASPVIEAAESAPEAEAQIDLSDAPQPVGLVEEVGVEEVEASEAVSGSPEAEQVDSVGSEDALEELPSRPRRRQRSYKIQEVIKRRQIILVQVVKEERGSKGAALTTYLSLAGRYTVLMPNTARGGGISRKITNAVDRKRLKAIAAELDVPEGMGLIIRTAGASRTKQEIKRDFEYLLRLWESVRDLTLQSTAPSLVYEEGDLIKRSIRDLYSKDIDEIIVAGGSAHREAKDFMRMLMPSHAKNVVLYQDAEPLFNRFQIERQLNAMFSPYVHLRSGGYLVINQTEALVAIDINSGKATREFSIEETALNTNLEAADEIARQLKLRDLAGLIVIDFIDMEEKRNNRAVERRVKEALRFDRARIQVGRISHFGLLEMSRQRLRTGVLEGSTSQCPHCQGTGIIRSTESVALAVIRGMEDALMAGQPASLVAKTTATVALYILNNKRAFINEMEARYGISISVQASDKLQGANFAIEKSARAAEPQRQPERSAVNMDWGFEGEEAEEAAADDNVREAHDEPQSEEGDGRRSRRRRRRRGRRGDRPESELNGRHHTPEADADASDDSASPEINGYDEHDDGAPVQAGSSEERDDDKERAEGAQEAGAGDERRGRRSRRRGRRGGRRDREEATAEGSEEPAANGAADHTDMGADEPSSATAEDVATPEPQPVVAEAQPDEPAAPVAEAPRAPKPERKAVETPAAREPEVASAAVESPVVVEAPKPVRTPRPEPVSSEPVIERLVVRPEAGAVHADVAESEAAQPARKGWWQRRFGAGE